MKRGRGKRGKGGERNRERERGYDVFNCSTLKVLKRSEIHLYFKWFKIKKATFFQMKVSPSAFLN
jgi:hypothetical protein